MIVIRVLEEIVLRERGECEKPVNSNNWKFVFEIYLQFERSIGFLVNLII